MSSTHGKRIPTAIASILIGLLASGCDWSDVLYGLALLDGGIIIINNDRGGCDEWYDFADPGCY